MPIDEEDICGLCGQPGADKFSHTNYWPGERIPTTEFVHALCEQEECQRAHSNLNNKQRKDFLNLISKYY